MEENTLSTISSDQLIKMLQDAVSVYGNRLVFVEINGHRYIINDMEFSVNGESYNILLS